jgi:hypothetical protein
VAGQMMNTQANSQTYFVSNKITSITPDELVKAEFASLDIMAL